MSKTMVVAPIMEALIGAEEILGKNREWNAVNETQKHFLEKYFSTRAELSRYSEKELRHWVNWVAAELNEILKKEGFDIQLQDFGEGEFGVVSILDVLVEWLVRGEETRIYVDNADYPAVIVEDTGEVEGGFRAFEAHTSSQHSYPIAMLHTKSGDKVYMTIADKPYQDFELITRINEIRSDLQRDQAHYDYLKFPMVDLNHEVNVSWLKRMWTNDKSGQKASISQALQQTKFKMNETGAQVKSAVAIVILTTSIVIEQPLIIDKPFFLWIERIGISVPVMYAYLDQEDWKDPGNLDL